MRLIEQGTGRRHLGICEDGIPAYLFVLEPAPDALPVGHPCCGGTVGQATLAPLVDPTGRPTTVQGTAAQAAFQSASMQLASSQGTRWSDPDLRAWEGDSGTLHTFQWSA